MQRLFKSNWSPLSVLAGGSFLTGLTFGLYGRKRSSFYSDYTYNVSPLSPEKYHIAIFCNFMASLGLQVSATSANPMLPAGLFISALVLHCVPVYAAGIREMQDKYFPLQIWHVSLLGIYLLVGGYVILFTRGRLF